MIGLVVYIPESHLEEVKDALFAAGAGKIGNYERCCFQTKGIGEFKPLENAKPFLGKQGNVESVVEWKVEMVLPKEKKGAVVSALKSAHPYETPAFWLIDLLNS
jgi:hypothetical protein